MKKGILLLLLIIAVALGVISFCACDRVEGSEGLSFALTQSGDSYFVKGVGSCVDADIVIPAEYEGKPVVSIGSSAFAGSLLKSITMPDSITIIGTYAFRDCNQLSSITLSSGLTSIYERAFCECHSLTSIVIPDSVTSISQGAFLGCYKLVEVQNKSSLNIVAGSEENGYVAYFAKNVYKEDGGSKLSTTKEGFVLYDGEEGIDLMAYIGTNKSIDVPFGVTSIHPYAFEKPYGYGNVIEYTSDFTSITIPSTVTTIGESAFRRTGLTSITIPSSVTYIGESAFGDCIDLVSVSLPNGLTRIEDYTFCGTALHSITIPDTVTSIGEGAFSSCTALTSIRYHGTKAQWSVLSESENWDENATQYTVYCLDGEISQKHF